MDADHRELSSADRKVLAIVDSLTEASQFVAAGSCPLELPGLTVDGVGDVALPVTATTAKKLIKAASQAPYGRGEQTIVDTDVRRVWQIEPASVRFANPHWPKVVDGIAERVATVFGLPAKVNCDFYKLLVYEKGSFFATHRDTEKQERMFATLVITLPSRHTGGQLVVRHDGLERRIRFDDEQAQYEIRYAAFYADCEHEVEPVDSGYRVNLVYNLSIPRQKQQPKAPEHQQEVAELSQLLAERFKHHEKLVLPLAHQYSNAGIQDALLKGSDRTRVNVLKRVAEALDLDLHLATMVRWQSGYPDYSTIDHDFGDSRRSRYSEPDYSNAQWEEVFDESTQLESWFSIDGVPNDLGKMELSESEFLSADSLDDLPFTQEINEATGNEGISMERWYQQTVLVLWPNSRHVQIVAQQGAKASVPQLRELVVSASGADDRRPVELANAIIQNWRPPQHRWGYESDDDGIAAEFAELIAEVGDVRLAQHYLNEVIAKGCRGVEGAAVARLSEKLGWAKLADALPASVGNQVPKTGGADLKSAVAFVHALCVTPVQQDRKRRAVLNKVLAELRAVIEAWDKYRDDGYSRRERGRDGILEQVFEAYQALGDEQSLSDFLTHAFSNKKYGLHDVLIPALQRLTSTTTSDGAKTVGEKCLGQLREHCIEQLESLTISAPGEPKHWAQKVKIKCDCEDCQRLQLFLHDEHETVCHFKVRKDRRHHLHRQIEAHRCDLDHTTDRRGSPQTLVCKKNRASFRQKAKAYETNLKLLEELRNM